MVGTIGPLGAIGAIGAIASAGGPLQIDVTLVLGALVSLALAGFVAFMIYLAFGSHSPGLTDDVTPDGQAESAAERPDPAERDERTDEAGAPEATDAEREPEFETGSGTRSSSSESGSHESD